MARSAKQQGYRLNKQFRSLIKRHDDHVWDGQWKDADSGLATRGFGVEVWVMRNGKIAIREAAFNVAPADQSSSLADVLC